MARIVLAENTQVGQVPLSSAKYRAFFKNAIEGFSPEAYCGEFKQWLGTYTGKTLGEAVGDYYEYQKPKSMEERLAEERFGMVSQADKAFITAFDREINPLGYAYGGTIGWGACWGRYMVIYTKGGIKGKQVAARIFIREEGIVLRMFLNAIDKHIAYIENAPAYIKDVFAKGHGDCGCNPKREKCNFRKTYSLGGELIEKCSGVVFEFCRPDLEKLPGYMGLLEEFYLKKRGL